MAASEATLRPIDPAPFAVNVGPLPNVAKMKRPTMKWMAVSELVVDCSYQREIGQRGGNNVKKIAQAFDWCQFGPVVVALARGERGKYAIIDGQHRVTAAALCGIKELPCLVVEADHERQAAAFAAINTQVTAPTPMQLHAARLVAGDVQAVLLDRVCRESGVTIMRYPVAAQNMKPGETLAAGQLRNYLGRYGKDILGTALRCITKTADGNIGMVRAPIIAALCSVFAAEPDFMASEKKLLAAMNKFNFAKQFDKALSDARATKQSFTAVMVDMIADHLDKHLANA